MMTASSWLIAWNAFLAMVGFALMLFADFPANAMGVGVMIGAGVVIVTVAQ